MLTNSCVATDSACTFPSEAVRNLEVIREHLVPTRKPVVQITVWSWIVHHWIRDTSVFTASLQELKLIRIKKDKKIPSLIWQGNFFLRTVLLWQINRSANAINTISNHSFQAFFFTNKGSFTARLFACNGLHLKCFAFLILNWFEEFHLWP